MTFKLKDGLSVGTTEVIDSGGKIDYARLKSIPTLGIAGGGTGATTAPAAIAALGGLPTAGGTMTNFITLHADPTNPLHAATKQYVDLRYQGLDFKDSVKVATTTNITLSAPQTIDGVSVVAGDRVLVKDQTVASQNGIYVVAAGAWTRASDADTSAKVTTGMYVYVEQGTAASAQQWVLSTQGPITLGTTNLVFSVFSTSGNITAGDGLVRVANTVNVVGTTDRILVNIDNIDIAPTYVGQTSITTLGAVSTGSWNATAIPVAKGGTGATTAAAGLAALAGAPLASPTLTGTPAAPTAAVGTNTTQIATTAFVNAEIANDAAPIAHVGSGGAAHSNVVAAGSSGFMTGADKTKLDGIATGANNYVHPTTDGSLHVPATGTNSANKVLAAGSTAGSMSWVTLDLSYLPGVALKQTVVAATTANITLSGTQTIDDIALVAGDRVLVKDQTSSAQNGIYVVAVGAWIRASDADTIDKIAGITVNVNVGTVNGGARFNNSLKTTDTLGTTLMPWGEVVDTTMAATVAPLIAGTAAVGTSLLYARQDHKHPTDTTRAALASPALTGTPTAPTAAVGTNTTQLATTAYVNAEIAADAAPIAHVGSTGTSHGVATTAVAGFLSATDKTKLDGIAAGAQVNAVTTVAGRTGAVVLAKADVGLSNVDDTSDVNKPVSTATQTELNAKAPLTGAGTSGTWPISVTGNAATSDWVRPNGALTYGNSGFQYFNQSGMSGNPPGANGAPTADWYHIFRGNHANPAGYYVDLALGLNDSSMWYRRISGGNAFGWYRVHDTSTRCVFNGATGRAFDNSAIEVTGGGTGSPSTYPAIGFHQPGLWAGTLQMQDGNWFAFLNQGENAYGSLRVAELSASGNVTAYSDICLKSDLTKIPQALDKVCQLNGYTYTRTDTGERQTGVVAQELQKVLPEAVTQGEKYLSVAYGNVVGLLVEAIKELKGEIEQLKKERA